MRDETPPPELSLTELLTQLRQVREELARLEMVNAELSEENARLRQENTQLKQQLEEQERSAKRQAAPFSKNKKKAQPKKPGRKPGQGPFRRRAVPAPEDITTVVEVPLETERCPACDSPNLGPVRTERAYRTDLPDEPKPEVTEYRIEVRTCLDCGRTLRAQHPDVDATQLGATAHRLGEGVLARAHVLHYGLGVPMRKVPAILRELCGVSVTQGALQQDALRRSRQEVGTEYQRLRDRIKDSARVFTDDTGWRINGETAYLMGFDTDEVTVYQIRKRHRNDEVRELIPPDDPGVMETDRAPSYDARELETVAQQKCVFHIIRSIDKVLEHKNGAARGFGADLKQLFREAIQLWDRYHQGETEGYREEAERLKKAIEQQLQPRELDDPDHQRLLDGLRWHHCGGNLLRFLDEPDVVEPTNNRAERALRPAVIARKVSHCSKNEAGAHAYAAFKSVLETLRKQGKSMVKGLLDLFRSPTTTVSESELPPLSSS